MTAATQSYKQRMSVRTAPERFRRICDGKRGRFRDFPRAMHRKPEVRGPGRELQDHCAERALILPESGRTGSDLPDRVPSGFLSTLSAFCSHTWSRTSSRNSLSDGSGLADVGSVALFLHCARLPVAEVGRRISIAYGVSRYLSRNSLGKPFQ